MSKDYKQLYNRLLTFPYASLSSLLGDFVIFNRKTTYDDRIEVCKAICDRIYPFIYYLYNLSNQRFYGKHIGEYIYESKDMILMSAIINAIDVIFNSYTKPNSYVIQIMTAKTLFKVPNETQNVESINYLFNCQIYQNIGKMLSDIIDTVFDTGCGVGETDNSLYLFGKRRL